MLLAMAGCIKPHNGWEYTHQDEVVVLWESVI